jgi:hypothetical protein
MKLTLGVFSGAVKALHPKLVGDTAGVDSLNQKPGRGDLRPWRQPLHAATVPASAPDHLPHGPRREERRQYWLSWTTRVHVVRGYDGADTTERTYFTGSGTPKWIDNTFALAAAARTRWRRASWACRRPSLRWWPLRATTAPARHRKPLLHLHLRQRQGRRERARAGEPGAGVQDRRHGGRRRIAAPPGGYDINRIRVYAPSPASRARPSSSSCASSARARSTTDDLRARARCWRPTAGSCRRRT